MSFDSLGLRAELLHAIADQEYIEPTPVQRQAIPQILTGRDLFIGAQTGTGKTAAFALPMLHKFSTEPSAKGGIRALVLTPTRELADQVGESFRVYGKYLDLKSTVVFGGVSYVPQEKALRSHLDILIATPGRLLDHMGQGKIDLSQVEILVLDEADRMLDMGFIPDVKRILGRLPKSRQNLLCSATITDEVRRLGATFLRDPEQIQVTREASAPETIKQSVYPVDRERKQELLSHLIISGNWHQVLVFARTKHGASRLAMQLARDGIEAEAIHGDRTQQQRTRALGDFKKGRIRVLVGTDVASRGLDIDQLPYVVNYDLPDISEDYVHRIGRTGRAGNPGEAVSLVCVDEHRQLMDIEYLTNLELPRIVVDGFQTDPDRQQTSIPRGHRPSLSRRPPSARRAGPPARQRGQGRGPGKGHPAAARGTRSPRGSVRGSRGAARAS